MSTPASVMQKPEKDVERKISSPIQTPDRLELFSPSHRKVFSERRDGISEILSLLPPVRD